jgi:RNAse (barnase) inhibitor barstar
MLSISKKIKEIDAASQTQLVLDGAIFSDMTEVHKYLKQELSFESSYKGDLDILFDDLCNLPEDKCPLQIVIKNGINFLTTPEDREEFFCLLNDVQETWSDVMNEDFFTVIIEDFEKSQDFFDMLFIKTERI